jgi:TPR repeat protein
MRVHSLNVLAATAVMLAVSTPLAWAGDGKPTNLIPELRPVSGTPLGQVNAGYALPAANTHEVSLSETAPRPQAIAAVDRHSGLTDNDGLDAMAAAVEAFASGNYDLAKVLLAAPGREDDPIANYCLGVMREYGLGMERDAAEAFKHYRISAEGGHPQSSYNLALMYADGRGTGVDDEESFRWTKYAAEKGLPAAQHSLGLMYYNGIGTEKDEVRALMWFELAAASGHTSSENSRDALARSLNREERIKARQMASLWQPIAN